MFAKPSDQVALEIPMKSILFRPVWVTKTVSDAVVNPPFKPAVVVVGALKPPDAFGDGDKLIFIAPPKRDHERAAPF